MKTVSDISLPQNNLQSEAQRNEILRGIERGEKNIKEGYIITHQQAKEKLKKWL